MENTEGKSTVEQIVELCKKKKIPVSRLEKDLGYGNGYLNPKKIKEVKTERLVEILNYLEVSIEEFYGIGSPQLQETETTLLRLKRTNPELYAIILKEKPATESDGLVKEPYSKWIDKNARLLMWFRSLPPEKQKAILISQDAPEDLV